MPSHCRFRIQGGASAVSSVSVVHWLAMSSAVWGCPEKQPGGPTPVAVQMPAMQPGVSAKAQSALATQGARATWVVQALVSAAAMAAW